MNDRTVILEPERWERLWAEMCDDLGYIPSWDEYPNYFGCIFCDSIDGLGWDSGFKAVFATKEEALLFKLGCG